MKLSVLTFLLSCAVCSFAAARPMRLAVVIDTQTKKQVYIETIGGITAAVASLNQSGEKVILDVIDSHGDGVSIKRAAETAVKRGADAVVAEVDSSKAAIAAMVLEAAKVPMIAPFATSPDVTTNRRFVFRACFSDAFQGLVLGRFVWGNLAAKKVAIVYDPTQLYSKTLKEEFEKSYKRLGGAIVHEEELISSNADFSRVIDAVVASKANAIFLPLYEETVAKLFSEAIRKNAFQEMPIIGGDGWAAGEIFGRLVSAKRIPFKAYWVLHHDPRQNQRHGEGFRKAYQKIYKVDPLTSAAFLGHDAVMMAYAAFSRAAQLHPVQIADEMRKTDFVGAAGRARFVGSQDPQRSLYIMSFDGNMSAFFSEVEP